MRIRTALLSAFAILVAAGCAVAQSYPCPLCIPVIGKYLG